MVISIVFGMDFMGMSKHKLNEKCVLGFFLVDRNKQPPGIVPVLSENAPKVEFTACARLQKPHCDLFFSTFEKKFAH